MTKPIKDSYLYPIYDRVGYRVAFGKEAPRFNPSKAPKRWFSTDGQTSFHIASSGSPNGVGQMSLDEETVQSVNLVGPVPDPPFISVGTDDLAELTKRLGGVLTVEHGVGTASNTTWNVIIVDKQEYNAFGLLLQWYKIGINKPGKLRIQDGALVLDPDPSHSDYPIVGVTPPELPIPIKPLEPGEKITFDIIGNAFINSDEPSGGFTESDREMLRAIYSVVGGKL